MGPFHSAIDIKPSIWPLSIDESDFGKDLRFNLPEKSRCDQSKKNLAIVLELSSEFPETQELKQVGERQRNQATLQTHSF